MKPFLLLIILVVLATTVSAQEITVERTAQETLRLGEELTISIKVTNLGSSQKDFKITEILPQTIQLINPPTPTETKFFNAVEASFLIWERSIQPSSTETITYIIKPLSLGENSLTPTKVEEIATGLRIDAAQLNFKVLCTPNNSCEKGETYLSCPQDCSSGADDGICHLVLDGECDPDCETDPDCKDKGFTITLTHIIITLIIITLIGIFLLLRKKKPKEEPFQPSQRTNPPQQN